MVGGLALSAFFALRVAVAQPQLPATFYGTASIDGAPVPDGTPVRALIDGKDCTQPGPAQRGTIRDGGVSAYVLTVMHESQEPGCGREGKTVTFTIGGWPATQVATWRSGAPQRLDLNAGAGQAPPLPTPTPAPPGSAETPPPATGTTGETTPAGAGSTPAGSSPSAVAATPVSPPPGLSPLVTARPSPPLDRGAEGSGGSAWLPFLAAVVVLALAGAGAGFVLSRGQRRK